MGKPTVSVLGCCVSRDIFGFISPDEYEVKRCVTKISPLSMVMEKPKKEFNVDLTDISTASNYSKRITLQDLNKSFFAYL